MQLHQGGLFSFLGFSGLRGIVPLLIYERKSKYFLQTPTDLRLLFVYFYRMNQKSLFIGQNRIELDKIDSTNNYASDLLSKKRPIEGTVILAHEQTAGKGQRGSTWETKAGLNLTVSIILYPRQELKKQFFLNEVVSLALCDYVITELGEQVKIKWPNDIFFKDKKIAGVLIENSVKGSVIDSSVIGIGLNVNQTAFGNYPLQASSLKAISGKEYLLQNCLDAFCSFLEARYLQLKAGNEKIVQEDYHKALYRLGEFHNYIVDEKNILAKITGVSEEGKLLIETDQKEKYIFDNKEIRFVI